MALKGVEVILIGYNTPMHYAPDPSQDVTQSFHNQLVMQAGAHQNGTWVVGVAKGGLEEGVDSLAESMIIAPSGQIIAQATTAQDELVVADCDLDWCKHYKETLFDFDRYRRPEMYDLIAEPKQQFFNLNGSPVSVSDQHQHLLSALRDELGVISSKDGCAPQVSVAAAPY